MGDATPRIYISLPLRGPSGADGRDAADGARLALGDAGERAGGLALEAVFLDDTEGVGDEAAWSPAKAATNAREATQDSTAIAFLGDFASGATRASLPITNEARMLQVSPASSGVDLVAPFPGTDELPDTQPSGERSFGRVIPADDAQSAAAAQWARELGARSVAIESDGTAFGRELGRSFTIAAKRIGLELARRGALTYLAGTPPPSGGKEIGSDAYLEPGGVRRPTRLTSAALDPSQLPAAGRDFAERFESEYGRAPGRYAAYGYEAMAVILDSIDRASNPVDRSAVIAAFFETADRDSVLGTYSIDEVGDTTLDRFTGYGLERGRLEAVAELSAG
ncbi:MAG: branched-chain amino acid ABC transporter substrate-binding protein [Solirubrobacterales bacterium]